jgi:RNA polymerase sigma-70 factor (ECF subfamily)
LRSKHRRTVELDSNLAQENGQPSAQEQIEQNETLGAIQKLMNRLPERQKLVMQLRDIEGMTYKEIEEVLDMPVGQVKTNLFRARQKMKKLITQHSRAVQ